MRNDLLTVADCTTQDIDVRNGCLLLSSSRHVLRHKREERRRTDMIRVHSILCRELTDCRLGRKEHDDTDETRMASRQRTSVRLVSIPLMETLVRASVEVKLKTVDREDPTLMRKPPG